MLHLIFGADLSVNWLTAIVSSIRRNAEICSGAYPQFCCTTVIWVGAIIRVRPYSIQMVALITLWVYTRAAIKIFMDLRSTQG